MCYNEGFDEISRPSGPLPQWRTKVQTILNLLGPQNAGRFFSTFLGLGYLRQILLRGVLHHLQTGQRLYILRYFMNVRKFIKQECLG